MKTSFPHHLVVGQMRAGAPKRKSLYSDVTFVKLAVSLMTSRTDCHQNLPKKIFVESYWALVWLMPYVWTCVG